MNGFEIERMLERIDRNIESTQRSQNAEMLRYIREHEDDIIRQLQAHGDVNIPTSLGMMTVPASVLRPA